LATEWARFLLGLLECAVKARAAEKVLAAGEHLGLVQCVPADRAANLVLERIERLQQGGLHGV
jgi:hypothetical protein